MFFNWHCLSVRSSTPASHPPAKPTNCSRPAGSPHHRHRISSSFRHHPFPYLAPMALIRLSLHCIFLRFIFFSRTRRKPHAHATSVLRSDPYGYYTHTYTQTPPIHHPPACHITLSP
ncbi:hypothetical protein ACI65C_009780 [Semiaphis heraclei]